MPPGPEKLIEAKSFEVIATRAISLEAMSSRAILPRSIRLEIHCSRRNRLE